MHEITKKDVSPDNPTEHNSYGKDEGEEYQEQQENDRNDKEITDRENTSQYFLNMMHDVMEERVFLDNLTEYINSYAKIEGRKCQQLESTERAESIQSVEENIESNLLDLGDKEVENI
ncbi:hypothetical protein RF55_22031 [Lasius niger]|uniref:Uncharacterized protein n=1 Tax=Lasius niger TaxID=67767 RepID=A0A0J7JXZ1_LASNI|nr:hypothetical protein RF55_22031 [Lasius niger]